MNILYIAYSCDPYTGSENKIGWNIPLEASKSHRVFVLTKEEHRESITRYCEENGFGDIEFFYADIKDIYKKIFRPPFYSGRLNIWHKRALPVAEKICRENGIEIIHQIAPIEFRSIGKYYKIKNTKFVCGPIAGGQEIPEPLMDYTGKSKPTEVIRSLINRAYRIFIRLSGRLKRVDALLYANYETKAFLEPNESRRVIPETAIRNDELSENVERSDDKDKLTFLVVSRFTGAKGYNLLFDALKDIPDALPYELKIIGYGELENEIRALYNSNETVSRHTEFLGALPFSEMSAQYRNADALIFPTFREATGSVILEAMANGLPVITMNRCGGTVICSPEYAYLFTAASKKGYVNHLRFALLHCINNPDEVHEKGRKARDAAERFTFGKRVEMYTEIYEELLNG
ncbi:MAG: glycosyltransferase family 4 protein [Eubacterium sp.]|nr:glycosyltransferase family 4 protein [Eubacterium sp.]